jgi:hypothetical protein
MATSFFFDYIKDQDFQARDYGNRNLCLARGKPIPDRPSEKERKERQKMLIYRAVLPATPLAPESIPLLRHPHNPRTERGHYAGGLSQTRDKALMARPHRQAGHWSRAGD